MTEQHQDEGYAGPAEVLTKDGSITVEVTLRGLFQPIDGLYHWYGRIARDERLADLGARGAGVVLRTPEGEAAGRLADEDPWGRYRIAGTGTPPFRAMQA